MCSSDLDILTPGDSPDVLVAMNPAALKANLADIKKGATIIVDSHDFTARNLSKAAYAENPLENGSLSEYDVHAFELTDMRWVGFGLIWLALVLFTAESLRYRQRRRRQLRSHPVEVASPAP